MAVARGATILGEVLGGASNADAHHITAPVARRRRRDRLHAARARRCRAPAGRHPPDQRPRHLTPLNDAAEAAAVDRGVRRPARSRSCRPRASPATRSAPPARSKPRRCCCRSSTALIPPTANTKVLGDDMEIDVVMGERPPVEPGPDAVEQLRLRRPQRLHHPRPRLIRTPPPAVASRSGRQVGLDHDEHQVALAWRPRRSSRARPDPLPARADMRPSSTLEDQFVARTDLATEPRAVETAEQRQLAGEPLVGEHRERTHLGDRLAHQHAGQRRAAGEVAGEEPLVAGQPPARRAPTDPGTRSTISSTNRNGGRCGSRSSGRTVRGTDRDCTRARRSP